MPTRGRAPLIRRLMHLYWRFSRGLTFGVRGLSGAVEQNDSTLHQATGLIGPAVSGSFLFLIGMLNLMVLASVLGIFRRMRHGEFDERELEAGLEHRPASLGE